MTLIFSGELEANLQTTVLKSWFEMENMGWSMMYWAYATTISAEFGMDFVTWVRVGCCLKQLDMEMFKPIDTPHVYEIV